MSLSSVPFLSVRDRIQLFALSATALLISFLGLLALAEIVVVLPLGFDAALKALRISSPWLWEHRVDRTCSCSSGQPSAAFSLSLESDVMHG